MNHSELKAQTIACAKCNRLRLHCEKVALTRKRAYQNEAYWGKPITGFGDPQARLWIIGLAPGAHGANRTGRIFTGDRSGEFLFAALHRLGLANQPQSVSPLDGLKLKDVFISCAVRCAPLGNKPLPDEIANCAGYLDAEWKLLHNTRVLFALGKIGWDASLQLARRNGLASGQVASFGHGASIQLSPKLMLIGSYHVSQQNTFTGRLTKQSFDAVLSQALGYAGR